MSRLQDRIPRQLLTTLRLRLRDAAIAKGLFVTGAEWSIGVGTFHSLDDFRDLSNTPLTLSAADVFGQSGRLVADPFLFEWQARTYLFMEALDAVSEKGVIGWAELGDDGVWRFGGIALERPFHLSYPHLLESDGEIYLIPETSSQHSIYLYRASRFPSEWEYCATLLEGAPFSDASLVNHGGFWWMFVETSPGPRFDTLRLFMSPHLEGPWIEHRSSPIVQGDAQAARPAGPPVWLDGKLIRFAQDCRAVYGKSVFGFEITHLSPAAYEERPLGTSPLLSGRGSGWNGQAMHHVSVLRYGEQWLAAVDGRPMPGFRLPTLSWRGRRRGSARAVPR